MEMTEQLHHMFSKEEKEDTSRSWDFKGEGDDGRTKYSLPASVLEVKLSQEGLGYICEEGPMIGNE